jgi:lipoprotein-anchoring transpeptidase ErfK/SrfK
MPDMMLEEMPDVKCPRRWPWAVLAVIVIAALVAARYLTRERAPATPAAEPTDNVQAAPAAAVVAQPQAPVPAAGTNPVAALPEAEASVLKLADDMERDGALQEAREKCYELYASTNLAAAVRRDIEDRLGRLNTALVLSPMKMPEKKTHVVKAGESLQIIAKKYGTTVESVQRGNQIMNPNRIKAGDMFVIFTGTFRIEVNKTRNELVTFLNDRFFKRYPVATGKYGKTPVGTFEVRDKTAQPTWWRPDGKEVPYGDAENILGTRWMSIRATGTTEDVRGYGIHGTWDDASVGSAASAGCVRMHNKDVEELFDLIPPGTLVTITE